MKTATAKADVQFFDCLSANQKHLIRSLFLYGASVKRAKPADVLRYVKLELFKRSIGILTGETMTAPCAVSLHMLNERHDEALAIAAEYIQEVVN